jgi:hypothetical protein
MFFASWLLAPDSLLLISQSAILTSVFRLLTSDF